MKQNWWLTAICATLCALPRHIVPTLDPTQPAVLDVYAQDKVENAKAYIDNQLEGLEHGAEMFEPDAENTLAEVCIGPDRILVAIERTEELPQDQTGVTCDKTHCHEKKSLC